MSDVTRILDDLQRGNAALLDYRLLGLIHPTSDGDQEELKVGRHGIK